jgi:mannose-6-phosphate isomerase
LRILDFTPTPDLVLRPEIARDGVELEYRTPAPEFAVSVLQLDGDNVGHEVDAPSSHDGPQVLVCTEGSAEVHAKGGDTLTLQRGAAAWVTADDGPIRLLAAEPVWLFRVTVGT